ncbi:Xaa-Pro dipeptidase [Modicisalibacter sp. 'Wilcox']|uniref:Xaa-Pro dipeptidase n=1 Tax=Modicisalibacter sp. 'Wilcox' TaxID=2679914 RepID=UPI0013D80438|nr:Xaa-Pro dipeptidase [Modicisalibacter sp. 'Wilcox']
MTRASVRNTRHAVHLDALEHAYADILASHGYDAVLLYSGQAHTFFADDQQASFAPFGHFLHWVPLPGIQHSWLRIRPGDAPLLRFHAPKDFWHLAPEPPTAAWTHRFAIEPTPETGPPATGGGRVALLGEVEPSLARELGAELNPPALLAALDELRLRKSAYEIDRLRDANRLALAGHRAARDAFEAGGAELDIQLAYLAASRQRESDVPYQNIVGLNAHGGVLHYQHYDLEPPARQLSLLVDAGRRDAGYCADITRTWAGRDADPRFAALIEAVTQLQQSLIDAIAPGVAFPDLHRRMHQQLGELLVDQGLVCCSAAAAVERGMTRAFCPHGLGHSLGLQVHDVGGRRDAKGRYLPPPRQDPALRLTRTLETGMVVTVEPGLYGIPMLLEPLRDTSAGCDIAWDAVASLYEHGGIRIEDNVAVTETGADNLTRET